MVSPEMRLWFVVGVSSDFRTEHRQTRASSVRMLVQRAAWVQIPCHPEFH